MTPRLLRTTLTVHCYYRSESKADRRYVKRRCCSPEPKTTDSIITVKTVRAWGVNSLPTSSIINHCVFELKLSCGHLHFFVFDHRTIPLNLRGTALNKISRSILRRPSIPFTLAPYHHRPQDVGAIAPCRGNSQRVCCELIVSFPFSPTFLQVGSN